MQGVTARQLLQRVKSPELYAAVENHATLWRAKGMSTCEIGYKRVEGTRHRSGPGIVPGGGGRGEHGDGGATKVSRGTLISCSWGMGEGSIEGCMHALIAWGKYGERCMAAHCMVIATASTLAGKQGRVSAV